MLKCFLSHLTIDNTTPQFFTFIGELARLSLRLREISRNQTILIQSHTEDVSSTKKAFSKLHHTTGYYHQPKQQTYRDVCSHQTQLERRKQQTYKDVCNYQMQLGRSKSRNISLRRGKFIYFLRLNFHYKMYKLNSIQI